VVTLRRLPPEGSYFEFSADIVAGRRPEFLPEVYIAVLFFTSLYFEFSQDPNYPLPLIECVRGCWAQDYTKRPTAKMIEDNFKSPNCLWLKNSYNVKNATVNAILVTKAIRDDVEEELIWVASTSREGYKLAAYTFAEQEDSPFHKIIKMKKTIHPKLCVTVSSVECVEYIKLPTMFSQYFCTCKRGSSRIADRFSGSRFFKVSLANSLHSSLKVICIVNR